MMHQKQLFYIYALTILFVMCSSNNLLFTWPFPKGLIVTLSIVVPLIYMGKIRLDTNRLNTFLCLLWSIIALYQIWNREISSFNSLSNRLGHFICVISVILLPVGKKKLLLDIVAKGLIVIIAISLPPWILHLVGVPLPHSAVYLLDDGVHWVTNYYFFLTGDEFNVLKFPRFRGMFIEGGQCAPVCVFLFFAIRGKLKLWQAITLITAIVLSFSLAGYVIFVLCYFLTHLLESKRLRIFKTCLFTSIVAILFSWMSNSSNSPFNELIVQRLTYDEELGLAGNNRSTDHLDVMFEKMMKSSDRFFGYGSELAHSDDNWTADSSGIKKFLLWNGIVGTVLLLMFVIGLVVYKFCSPVLILGIAVILNFLVRDLLLSDMWIIIFILGSYVKYASYLEEKQ